MIVDTLYDDFPFSHSLPSLCRASLRFKFMPLDLPFLPWLSRSILTWKTKFEFHHSARLSTDASYHAAVDHFRSTRFFRPFPPSRIPERSEFIHLDGQQRPAGRRRGVLLTGAASAARVKQQTCVDSDKLWPVLLLP